MAEIVSDESVAASIAWGIKDACSRLDTGYVRSSGLSDLRVETSHSAAYSDVMSHSGAVSRQCRAYANRLAHAGVKLAAVEALTKGAWK